MRFCEQMSFMMCLTDTMNTVILMVTQQKCKVSKVVHWDMEMKPTRNRKIGSLTKN